MSASLMVRKIRRFALPLLGAVLALAMALNALARQTPQELRRKADAYFDEKSYKLAGETYAQLLNADPKAADRNEIELRILVAEIKAEEWNRAVADAESFVKRYPDTRQEARAQVWRGRLYTLVPHEGYRVGKAEYRGGMSPNRLAAWLRFRRISPGRTPATSCFRGGGRRVCSSGSDGRSASMTTTSAKKSK